MDGGKVDVNSCQGAKVGTPVPFEGAKFQWLSANVVVSATGQTLLPAYGVKRFRGVPVAFIGMTLKDTPGIVVPTGVAGLEFRDEAATVNALVPKLRAEGIEAIVVLVHEGGVQTGSLQDINECAGNLQGTPIARIVAQLDDAVDVVLSGHTHAAYNCRLANAKGRPVPVSSANAFGRVLSDIDLKLDPATRDVVAVQVTNRLVDHGGVTPDAVLAGIVKGYDALVAPRAAVVIGSIGSELPNNAHDPACNMLAGALIADAQLAATAAPAFGAALDRLDEPRRRAHPRLHLQAAQQRRRRQRHLRRGLHRPALRQQPGDADADGAGHQGRARAAVRRLPRPAAGRHAHHAAVGRLQVPLGRQQGLRRAHPFGDADPRRPHRNAGRCRRQGARPGARVPRHGEQLHGQRRRQLRAPS